MARGPWQSFMPPNRSAAVSPNALRWLKHTRKKPARPPSSIQILRRTLNKFSATANRGTHQLGNSPRFKHYYRCRTPRPYRSRNSGTSSPPSRGRPAHEANHTDLEREQREFAEMLREIEAARQSAESAPPPAIPSTSDS